jgi:hypothetical protein
MFEGPRRATLRRFKKKNRRTVRPRSSSRNASHYPISRGTLGRPTCRKSHSSRSNSYWAGPLPTSQSPDRARANKLGYRGVHAHFECTFDHERVRQPLGPRSRARCRSRARSNAGFFRQTFGAATALLAIGAQLDPNGGNHMRNWPMISPMT